MQRHVEEGIPPLADGTHVGYTGTRLSDLLTATDILSVANRTTDITRVNEDLEHRFQRFGTNEVFIIYDWTIDPAGSQSS